MDLRQLRYFVKVAEAKGFNEAAVRLRIAQSSISRRIHDLEAELGVALFERHSRGTTLTEAGRILLSRADALLNDVEAARSEVVARSALPSGDVTVGTSPAFTAMLFPSLAQVIDRDFPRLNLRFIEGAQFALLEGLNTGRIDVAIMVNPESIRSCVLEPLLVEPLYFVTAPAQKPKTRLLEQVELVRAPLILFPRPTALRDHLDRLAEEIGAKVDVRYESGGLDTHKDFVRRGLVCAVLPMSAIHADLRRRTLAAVPIRGLSITRTLVARVDRGKSAAVATVIAAIRDVIRSLAADKSYGEDMQPVAPVNG